MITLMFANGWTEDFHSADRAADEINLGSRPIKGIEADNHEELNDVLFRVNISELAENKINV